MKLKIQFKTNLVVGAVGSRFQNSVQNKLGCGTLVQDGRTRVGNGNPRRPWQDGDPTSGPDKAPTVLSKVCDFDSCA